MSDKEPTRRQAIGSCYFAALLQFSHAQVYALSLKHAFRRMLHSDEEHVGLLDRNEHGLNLGSALLWFLLGRSRSSEVGACETLELNDFHVVSCKFQSTATYYSALRQFENGCRTLGTHARVSLVRFSLLKFSICILENSTNERSGRLAFLLRTKHILAEDSLTAPPIYAKLAHG